MTEDCKVALPRVVGLLHAPFHFQIDCDAYTLEILADIKVCKSHDFQTETFQIFNSCHIIRDRFVFIMLRAVKFNHKLGFRAVKIYNISPYNSLPIETNLICAQIIIPQMVLFFCGIVAKL